MADGIQSVTSSEWKLVQRRLDDLENLVSDLKMKLEILGECKCNRSNSSSETQHSDDEETEIRFGLNTPSNLTSAASGILKISAQSTTYSKVEEILTLAGRDATQSADTTSTSAPTTGSKLSDIISANTADNGNNGTPVSTTSTSGLSNGIGIQDLEKYRRAQVKLTRCDQVEVTGTSSSSEYGIRNNKFTLTSSNKVSHIPSKKRPVLRRKGKGVRDAQIPAPQFCPEKRFVCHICSKRFGQKPHLTVHIRVHTGDKPFHCNICSMKFTVRSDLTRHSRVHSGDKPFECGFCPKKFSNKQALTRHTRVHTGEKPFECGFCSKKFSESQSLVMHMRSHTGERPYSCPLCTEVFALHIQMKRHLKRHPGETPRRQGQIHDEEVP